ncbi:MAG: glycoside hydrolase [Acidobacteria bacterium]|nr:glycoside hydrolase [Acidobacteriota bacterium]
MGEPLYVTLLWHMHQPRYQGSAGEPFLLPWVRLHAAKDYLDMGAVVGEFPDLRVTFNFVPCLLEQIEEYQAGATDLFEEMTLKDAASLSPSDQRFLLKNFFLLHWDRMLAPFPRYGELLRKRGTYLPRDGEAKGWRAKDFRDLQLLYNLAWCGNVLRRDPEIRSLIRKERNYSEDDKRLVLGKHREALARIIPLFRELGAGDQVELSTTPFYHPILPLVYNMTSAREALPQVPLPSVPVAHPDDARIQLEQALEYHEKLFGKLPEGVWAAEGSLSEDVVQLMARVGVRWTASDEALLSASLEGRAEAFTPEGKLCPEALYTIHARRYGETRVCLFFRDHELSDLIGFTYAAWDAEEAARDFVQRLERIHDSLGSSRGPHVVPIILDGENAWEFYPENGAPFLRALYQRLTHHPHLRTATFTECLRQQTVFHELPRMRAGSWISGNFAIWIGQSEKNRAWEVLERTREFLLREHGARPDPARLEKAWKEIYIAQGSDWFWWYGDDHFSEHDAEFDLLFRSHLKNVYRLLDHPVPSFLEEPIREPHPIEPARIPTALLHPAVDGQVTDYFEWLHAGLFLVGRGHGAMHQARRFLSSVYYGFDAANLYLRIDLELRRGDPQVLQLNLELRFQHLTSEVLRFSLGDGLLRIRTDDEERLCGQAALGKVAELSIPFQDLRLQDGSETGLLVILSLNGQEIERWPHRGWMRFRVDTQEVLESWNA